MIFSVINQKIIQTNINIDVFRVNHSSTISGKRCKKTSQSNAPAEKLTR
jgi:hypothetical protein